MNRRKFGRGFKDVRKEKREVTGTEYSPELDSDIYYLEEANIMDLVSKMTVDGGSEIQNDEDVETQISLLKSPGYRFARIYARRLSNQKNIFSRCLSMLSTGDYGQAIRTKWIQFMELHKNAHDSKVVEYLAGEYDRMRGDEKDESVRDLDDRAAKRVKHIKTILENEAIDSLRGGIYLDYGGNMWHNSAHIGKAFDMKDIYIADIIDRRADHPDNIKYIKLSTDKSIPFRLPFEDGTVNLITMFMVAHHIDNNTLGEILGEFYRVLVNGGIVIVREHDLIQTFEDTDDRLGLRDVFDTLHFMHSAIWKSETDFNDHVDYEDMGTIYRSFDDYMKMFKKAKLVEYKKPYMIQDFRRNYYNTGTLSFTKQ